MHRQYDKRNFHKICRVCGELSKKMKLQSITAQIELPQNSDGNRTTLSFLSILENVTGVKVSGQDELPRGVCELCVAKTKFVFEFIGKFHETQKNLKNFGGGVPDQFVKRERSIELDDNSSHSIDNITPVAKRMKNKNSNETIPEIGEIAESPSLMQELEVETKRPKSRKFTSNHKISPMKKINNAVMRKKKKIKSIHAQLVHNKTSMERVSEQIPLCSSNQVLVKNCQNERQRMDPNEKVRITQHDQSPQYRIGFIKPGFHDGVLYCDSCKANFPKSSFHDHVIIKHREQYSKRADTCEFQTQKQRTSTISKPAAKKKQTTKVGNPYFTCKECEKSFPGNKKTSVAHFSKEHFEIYQNTHKSHYESMFKYFNL